VCQRLASGCRIRRSLARVGQVRKLSGCLGRLVFDILGNGTCVENHKCQRSSLAPRQQQRRVWAKYLTICDTVVRSCGIYK